ncbi:hypothetical protein F5Y16DRAFT_410982 [Xylariaceae sp. FL0255]|nr:hypothetical protein F5Y16DRAFT_410982 [Xylariaceae sp. FL0255]
MSQESWLTNSAETPPRRKSTHVLLQDEGAPLLGSRTSGALSQLLRNRSHASLHNYGSSWRGGTLEDEETGLALAMPSAVDDDDYLHHARRPLVEDRRLSRLMNKDSMRSMRLIGNSNPRYKWERYWKTEDQLKAIKKKSVRRYYERCNYLIQQYLYIDRLLDSSVPHDLLNEYNDLPPSSFRGVEVPETISEESASLPRDSPTAGSAQKNNASKKVKRTPKDIYRPTETTPLFNNSEEDEEANGPKPEIPWLEDDDDMSSNSRVVTVAIYVNFAANLLLLAGKIAVVASVSSMSVLASLVDAVLDFFSTVIVWTTTVLIARQDQYKYPVGRRRLEPLGVLVFSVIMITSFVQVALESFQRLIRTNHEVIELGIPALAIMIGTVVIKGLCWLWCRLVRNSSVQALADDAMTDVIFNTGSILFPIIGFYANIWWLDALGGLLLSLVVIRNWSSTSLQHIKNLSGFSATANQRNVLLYLTMRFAKTIRQIQGLQAYHAGDKLNVEVDIILDASTTLRDTHDLSESLGYVLESVPIVDRAFVHADYASYNLPTHMEQQSG